MPPEERSFSQNRALAAEAGRKGGQSRGANAQAQAEQNAHAAPEPEADDTPVFDAPIRGGLGNLKTEARQPKKWDH